EVVRVVQPVELAEDWNKDFAGAASRRGFGICCLTEAGAARDVRARAPLNWAAMRCAKRGGRGVRADATPPAPPSPSDASVAKLFAQFGELFERTESAGPAGTIDRIGELARAQQADGGFGGDIARTATVLLILILSGNTRKTGPRRRVVIKAA